MFWSLFLGAVIVGIFQVDGHKGEDAFFAASSAQHKVCTTRRSLSVLCSRSEPCFLRLQASLPISAFGLADGVGGWADRVGVQDFRHIPTAADVRILL